MGFNSGFKGLNSHKVSVTEDVTRGGWEHRIYVSGEDRGHMGSLRFGRAVTWSLMFFTDMVTLFNTGRNDHKFT